MNIAQPLLHSLLLFYLMSAAAATTNAALTAAGVAVIRAVDQLTRQSRALLACLAAVAAALSCSVAAGRAAVVTGLRGGVLRAGVIVLGLRLSVVGGTGLL
ncbi:hypothetical protein UMZ34_23320 [Halopseudomonas pachastrellae]|nr:hypothetical protein UMZ34_23320 [Halopseudomonas pachastrellae]